MYALTISLCRSPVETSDSGQYVKSVFGAAGRESLVRANLPIAAHPNLFVTLNSASASVNETISRLVYDTLPVKPVSIYDFNVPLSSFLSAQYLYSSIAGRTISPSVTVTVCSTVVLLSASSFAVHVIVVVPIGNVPSYDTLPSASIKTVTLSELSLDTLNSVTSQLSVAVGFDITMSDALHETSDILATPLITGFSLSSTVTVCLHSLLLPFTSVTVQRTVCAPLSNVAV